MTTKCDYNENNECFFSHQIKEICDFRDGNYCYYPKDKRLLGDEDD